MKIRINGFIGTYRVEIDEKSKELGLTSKNNTQRWLNLTNNPQLRAWAVERGLEL